MVFICNGAFLTLGYPTFKLFQPDLLPIEKNILDILLYLDFIFWGVIGIVMCFRKNERV
jgi:hypothetical protein